MQTPAFPKKSPLGISSLLGWSPRGALILSMGIWDFREGEGEQELCQDQGGFFMSKHFKVAENAFSLMQSQSDSHQQLSGHGYGAGKVHVVDVVAGL